MLVIGTLKTTVLTLLKLHKPSPQGHLGFIQTESKQYVTKCSGGAALQL